MTERICQFPPCQASVPDKRHKYCSDEHRKEMARWNYQTRRNEAELGLNDKVEREQERIRIREETRQLAQLQRSEAKRKEYIRVLEEVVTPFKPIPLLRPYKPRDNIADVEWGIELSDWQLGQYTPIQSTGGTYEQTTEIAARQLDKVWEAIQSIYEVEIKGGRKRLRRVWLLFNGDLIDGDCLRPSQARMIDRVATQQTLEAADLAGLIIRRVLSLPGVEEVIADFVGGNHDRTSQKAGNAGLGELDFVDTYAWLIGQWVKQVFRDEPRLSVKIWDTFYGYRIFGGLRHAFEHGASFRGGSGSYGGIPWYPISNAARKYVDMLGGVDMVHMGHFHAPAVLPLGQSGWVVMNGALPVSSQFIQSSFKSLRVPLQWLIEYNMKHRWVNNWHPLYADVGQFVPEGTVWTPEFQNGKGFEADSSAD